ncbi:MAG: C4-dicarboxylate ABC transporter permease [Desulfobacterales bacterium]|nr:MAG: C4-dicarboxylate ABC transporter permease [Desulfobacterales bacterium]
MHLIRQTLDWFSKALRSVGALALTTMMMLIVADVIGRFFKHPVFGSVELAGFIAAIVVVAALPDTYKRNSHVGVEILVRKLPVKGQLWMDIFTKGLTVFLFGLITWQMFLYAEDLRIASEVSMNLEIPVHYIVSFMAMALFIFTIIVAVDLFSKIQLLWGLKTP